MTAKTCPRCGATLPRRPDGATAPCPRCLLGIGLEATGGGAAGDAPAPEELAPLFPDLELLELVGQGGMGAVYRARQKRLDREVALKVLSPEASADPSFAERFTREARALAALSHPAITAVFDFGQAGERYWLLMEYVDGANLRQVLRAGKLAPKEALAMVGQMCDALAYAHGRGVVHRDIKPENVLVDRAGRVKIADFGLAKLLGRAPGAADAAGAGAPRLTRTDQAMGTWHYMAPEQVEHPLEVDHRADIFSLGVVFYELLTGELPLGHFAPPSQRVQVDVRLDDVVLKALAKEPERRYQTAVAVKTDVDAIAAGRPALAAAPAPRPTPAPAPPAPERRTGAGRVLAILASVALGFMLVFGCLGVGFLFLAVRPGDAVIEAEPHPDDVPPPVPAEPRAPDGPARDAGAGLPPEPGDDATQAEIDEYARKLLERAAERGLAPAPAPGATGEELE